MGNPVSFFENRLLRFSRGTPETHNNNVQRPTVENGREHDPKAIVRTDQDMLKAARQRQEIIQQHIAEEAAEHDGAWPKLNASLTALEDPPRDPIRMDQLHLNIQYFLLDLSQSAESPRTRYPVPNAIRDNILQNLANLAPQELQALRMPHASGDVSARGTSFTVGLQIGQHRRVYGGSQVITRSNMTPHEREVAESEARGRAMLAAIDNL